MDDKPTKAQAKLLDDACRNGRVKVDFSNDARRLMAERMVRRGWLEEFSTTDFIPTAAGKALWEMAQRIAAKGR